MSEHEGIVSTDRGINKLCPTQLRDVDLQEAIVELRLKRCPLCRYTVEKNGDCDNVLKVFEPMIVLLPRLLAADAVSYFATVVATQRFQRMENVPAMWFGGTDCQCCQVIALRKLF